MVDLLSAGLSGARLEASEKVFVNFALQLQTAPFMRHRLCKRIANALARGGRKPLAAILEARPSQRFVFEPADALTKEVRTHGHAA
jgi:hypothetical protein